MIPRANILHYFEMQKKEIDEHKWYLSEEAGFDVGEDFAVVDFIIKGYHKKFREHYNAHCDEIERVLMERGIDCQHGIDGQLTMDDIHRLLHDGKYEVKK